MIRIAMLLLIAFGVVGFGAIAWMLMPSEPAPVAAAALAPPVARIAVLVAARPMLPGLLLKPEDVAVSEIAEDKLPIGHVPDQANAKRALVGGMVLRRLIPGDIIRLPGDVLRPGDHGFLAAVLTPGTRAITVAVDVVSGTAGLIWPGDRVDLILTQVLEETNQMPGRRVVAETVLRDVRVIAIDQQLAQGITSNVGEAPVARTVTIEVSSSNAEHVEVATRIGKLSLVIRSAEAGPPVEVRSVGTYAGDVSHALISQTQRPASNSIKVFPGAAESREFKF